MTCAFRFLSFATLRETELQCFGPRSLLRPARKKKGGVPKDVAGVLSLGLGLGVTRKFSSIQRVFPWLFPCIKPFTLEVS